MIEVQALNNLLTNNNIDEYIQSGIQTQHFGDYANEYTFILNHYNTYGKCPDTATFIDKFNDFDLIDVLEPTDYIIAGLKENYVFRRGVELFQQSAQLLEKNSYDGLRNIISKAERLLEQDVSLAGKDINQMVQDKKEDIDSKRNKDGMLGISSGLPEIDRVLGGWLPGEELVTIVGRINQGKSWLLQKFLTEAHNQDKTVLHYSGEMGTMQVAYRHDTLAMNYSNRQLMFGTISDTDYDKYMNDIDRRKETKKPYIVVTPKELGGKPLDITTLRALIKKYKPDIIGIDQISLMEDERGKHEPTRIKHSHISMDLFNLSCEFGIPVLMDCQANRNKADEENPENPDLGDISESDGIGQNSSRVISLVQTKMGLSLFVPKNRYGEKGNTFIYSWDIDIGDFRYVQQQDNTDSMPSEKSEPPIPFRNKNNKEKQITDVF